MTRTLRLKAASATRADAVFVDRGRPGPTSLRHTINTHDMGTAFGRMPSSMRPPWYIERYSVAGVDPVSKVLKIDNLANYDSFAKGIFDGAELVVFHVSPERIAERARPIRVVETRIRHVASATWDRYVPKGSTLELRASPQSFSRPGAPYVFAVASVDAQGNRSAWVATPEGRSAARMNRASDSPPDRPDTERSALPALPSAGTFDAVAAPETALPAPRDVRLSTDNEGRQFVITWSAAPDEGAVAGYVVARSYEASFEPVSELRVDDVEGVRPGDFFYLRLRNDGTKTRQQLLSARVENTPTLAQWGFVPGNLRAPFRGDEPGLDWSWHDVEGTGHLRLDLAPGKRFGWWVAKHFGPRSPDLYHPPMKPSTEYTLTFRGRAIGSPKVVRIDWQTADDATSMIEVGTEWGAYRATIRTPAAMSDRTRALIVTATFEGGPQGASFDVIDLSCVETRYASDPTAPTDEQLAEMRACRPRYNRFHLVKGSPFGISALDFMSEVGLSNRDGLSLPHTLRWTAACNADLAPEELATRGMNPWIQVPAYWRADEYRALAEYLCTPYDPAVDTREAKPWAYLRHSQGRAEPWQSAFPELMVEAGNEPWNAQQGFYHYVGLDEHARSGGRINAFMLDRVASAFLQNSHVEAGKWNWYLNIWIVGGSYRNGRGFNYESLANSRFVTHAGYAGYIGGWDVSRTVLFPNETGFRSVLTDAYGPSDPSDRTAPGSGRRNVADRLVADLAAYRRDTGRAVVAEMYEQGPGYQIEGVGFDDQRAQEAIMKGVAAGTGFLAGILLAAARGVAGQNFFTYRVGTMFSSHAPALLGAAPSGAWQWFAWATRWAIGETVELDLELTDGLVGADGRDAGRAMSAFRITAPDHVTYVLFNFDAARDRRIVVPKPLAVQGPATRWEMTGDVATTNATVETVDAIAIVSEAEPEGFGSTKIDAVIGAGKCVAWVFDTRPAAR